MRRVFKFIESLIRDLESRGSVSSSLGGQLDRLRDGTAEILIQNPFLSQERSHLTALRLLVWNSVLKYSWGEFAQYALIMKNIPIGWTDKFRLVNEGDLIPNHEYTPPIWTTKSGEEIAIEEETKDPPPRGYRVVRSPKPLFPLNSDIARKLKISERKLRSILQVAYDTIENHALFELVA